MGRHSSMSRSPGSSRLQANGLHRPMSRATGAWRLCNVFYRRRRDVFCGHKSFGVPYLGTSQVHWLAGFTLMGRKCPMTLRAPIELNDDELLAVSGGAV